VSPYTIIEAEDPIRTGGKGDHGVIVLPCGAGKTVVGIETMGKLTTETLILTTSMKEGR